MKHATNTSYAVRYTDEDGNVVTDVFTTCSSRDGWATELNSNRCLEVMVWTHKWDTMGDPEQYLR